MTLDKISLIDKIEIIENGVIQIRRRDDILENGNIIASNYHRWTLSPGEDISQQDEKVKVVANAIWTPEVIAAYQEQLNNSLQNLQG